MDLTHLFSSDCDVEVPQQGEELEFRSREALFKRKGINFSTTTNEGRILRSSQETDRRRISRNVQQWKSRKDQSYPSKDQKVQVTSSRGDDHLRGKFLEGEVCMQGDLEKTASGQAGNSILDSITTKSQSRREKLNEYLVKKRQIQEEKRKKAKPVFHAGVFHHPFSVFSSTSNLKNQSKLSMSSSNLSLMIRSSQSSQVPRISRSSSLANIRLDSNKIGKTSLTKINEYEQVPKNREKILEKKDLKKQSFAPTNHEFVMKLENIAVKEIPLNDPEAVKDAFIDSIKRNSGFMTVDKKLSPKMVDKEDTEDTSSEGAVDEFRNLISKETARITKLCQNWEDKIPSIPDDSSFEHVKGEVRSVVGQGRLVMSERFHQFSGLVDNCAYNRGEKKTTPEDLRGFWEMIYIQVEDVNRKFLNLSKVENSGWKFLNPIPSKKKQRNVSKSTSSESNVSKSKTKEASSGLKALIAARRKAVKSASEPSTVSVEVSLPSPSFSSECSDINEIQKCTTDADKTFDGGFFSVKSPMLERKSPRSGKSSSNKLRQAAFTNSAKKSLLLSPFISAMAKMSLTPAQSSGSPMTSVKTLSPSSPSQLPRPLVLFKEYEGDEEEELKSGDICESYGGELLGSPKLDERYLKPTAASCVDLINFESPFKNEQ